MYFSIIVIVIQTVFIWSKTSVNPRATPQSLFTEILSLLRVSQIGIGAAFPAPLTYNIMAEHRAPFCRWSSFVQGVIAWLER